jgi:flagellar motility protein MotE (MotC chaperone)
MPLIGLEAMLDILFGMSPERIAKILSCYDEKMQVLILSHLTSSFGAVVAFRDGNSGVFCADLPGSGSLDLREVANTAVAFGKEGGISFRGDPKKVATILSYWGQEKRYAILSKMSLDRIPGVLDGLSEISLNEMIAILSKFDQNIRLKICKEMKLTKETLSAILAKDPSPAQQANILVKIDQPKVASEVVFEWPLKKIMSVLSKMSLEDVAAIMVKCHTKKVASILISHWDQKQVATILSKMGECDWTWYWVWKIISFWPLKIRVDLFSIMDAHIVKRILNDAAEYSGDKKGVRIWVSILSKMSPERAAAIINTWVGGPQFDRPVMSSMSNKKMASLLNEMDTKRAIDILLWMPSIKVIYYLSTLGLDEETLDKSIKRLNENREAVLRAVLCKK